MEVKLDFGDDEMKNFILKTGKYKITTAKCMGGNFFMPTEEIIEVAYPIDDTETEKWIMSIGAQPVYIFDHLSILSVFCRELRSKLLNL
jgi:hypothetical protein